MIFVSRSSGEEIDIDLDRYRYGDFWLTDAIRPPNTNPPHEGYKHDVYVDTQSKQTAPVMIVQASREKLLPLFSALVSKMESEVTVVLETSHPDLNGERANIAGSCFDRCVVESILQDYEDLLLHDGNAGIAIFNEETRQEVHFDEHKLLFVYGGKKHGTLEKIVRQMQIPQEQDIRFVTDQVHIHQSTNAFAAKFKKLAIDLGMDGGR